MVLLGVVGNFSVEAGITDKLRNATKGVIGDGGGSGGMQNKGKKDGKKKDGKKDDKNDKDKAELDDLSTKYKVAEMNTEKALERLKMAKEYWGLYNELSDDDIDNADELSYDVPNLDGSHLPYPDGMPTKEGKKKAKEAYEDAKNEYFKAQKEENEAMARWGILNREQNPQESKKEYMDTHRRIQNNQRRLHSDSNKDTPEVKAQMELTDALHEKYSNLEYERLKADRAYREARDNLILGDPSNKEEYERLVNAEIDARRDSWEAKKKAREMFDYYYTSKKLEDEDEDEDELK